MPLVFALDSNMNNFPGEPSTAADLTALTNKTTYCDNDGTEIFDPNGVATEQTCAQTFEDTKHKKGVQGAIEIIKKYHQSLEESYDSASNLLEELMLRYCSGEAFPDELRESVRACGGRNQVMQASDVEMSPVMDDTGTSNTPTQIPTGQGDKEEWTAAVREASEGRQRCRLQMNDVSRLLASLERRLKQRVSFSDKSERLEYWLKVKMHVDLHWLLKGVSE